MNEKRQIGIMTGVAMIVIAVIMIVVSSSPNNVYEDSWKESVNKQDDLTTSSQSTLKVEYPLNLNTATVEELMTISEIGENRARAIIEYRNVLGSYTSVEQIKNIEGIGDSLYSRISPYLTV